jgi:MHS family proline/betaine transporter-like MFS transporter
MIVLLPCMVGMGALSDRFGRKPLLLAATVLAFTSAVPLFTLMQSGEHLYVQLGQLGFVLSVGMFLGTQPTLMVEEVPAGVRCTAIAIGYNVTLGVVGGLSPLVATWLVERTADHLAPAYMIMAAAAVSFLSVLTFRAGGAQEEAATSAASA